MRGCNNSRLAAIVLLVSAGATLSAAADHYSIPLHSLFTPQTHTIGLYLKARIGGGPALRLFLDSGAQQIVLDKHAGASLHRQPSARFDLVGFGPSSGAARQVALVDVEVAGLTLRGCDILVVDSPLMEGIDGVIPLALFGDFLVRLDLRAKILDLEPYPPAPADGYAAARTDHHMLFLDGLVNGVQPGYILVDTGATYSALSLPAARRTKGFRVSPSRVPLHGAGGAADGFPLPAGVQFRIGQRTLSADPAIAIDLSDFDRHYSFVINGVLGYPALRQSILTVDYRDGLVRID